jgi:hypothetical protein
MVLTVVRVAAYRTSPVITLLKYRLPVTDR